MVGKGKQPKTPANFCLQGPAFGSQRLDDGMTYSYYLRPNMVTHHSCRPIPRTVSYGVLSLLPHPTKCTQNTNKDITAIYPSHIAYAVVYHKSAQSPLFVKNHQSPLPASIEALQSGSHEHQPVSAMITHTFFGAVLVGAAFVAVFLAAGFFAATFVPVTVCGSLFSNDHSNNDKLPNLLRYTPFRSNSGLLGGSSRLGFPRKNLLGLALLGGGDGGGGGGRFLGGRGGGIRLLLGSSSGLLNGGSLLGGGNGLASLGHGFRIL